MTIVMTDEINQKDYPGNADLEPFFGSGAVFFKKNRSIIELLYLLKQHPGPVIISGYMNDLYAELLKDWETQTRITNCEGALRREEVLWMNFNPSKQLSIRGDLYG